MGLFVESEWAFALAGVCALFGIIHSLYNIGQHLCHWHQPVFQLWIVRVLIIIPIYALISWISIQLDVTTRLYLEILRDWYEAFVIYCFLIWVLNAIGGEQVCGASIAQRMHMEHPWPLCCLPHIRLNARFLKICKQFALQFVVLKPVMGCVSFILLFIGGESLYDNEPWQIIMLTIYNISYTVALYGLFLFYLATKEEMDSYSPVRKFLAVKSIVFLTYWQSLFVPLVFGSQHADQYNDFILSIEMVVFSYLHYRAFPWWEFRYPLAHAMDDTTTDDSNYGISFRSWVDDDNAVAHSNVTISAAVDAAPQRPKNTKQVPLIESEIEEKRSMVDVDMATTQCNAHSFCCALWEVINVMDIWKDAYYNFAPATLVPRRGNSVDADGSEHAHIVMPTVSLRSSPANVNDSAAAVALSSVVSSNLSSSKSSPHKMSGSDQDPDILALDTNTSFIDTLVHKTDAMDLRKSDLNFEKAQSAKKMPLKEESATTESSYSVE